VTRALVVGSAATIHDDLHELAVLFELVEPEVVVAVNAAAFEVRPTEWASLHPELFWRDRGGPGWVARYARRGRGLPRLWGPAYKPTQGVRALRSYGRGSSGYFGVEVALALGASRIVLAGIPLTRTAHFDDDRPWDAAHAHARFWRARRCRLADVRSPSGVTKQILGAPSPEWWLGSIDDTEETE